MRVLKDSIPLPIPRYVLRVVRSGQPYLLDKGRRLKASPS